MNTELTQSIQKFTNSNTLDSILKLKTISKTDVGELTTQELETLKTIIEHDLNNSEDEKYDAICLKYSPILDIFTRNQIWENNHKKIVSAISTYIADYGSMPTKSKLSEITKLSRATIHKHFKEYENNPLYTSYIEQFHIMKEKVLGTILKLALNDDLKAAKLYFEILRGTSSKIDTITINGCTINIQMLNTLDTDKLSAFLNILRNHNIDR